MDLSDVGIWRERSSPDWENAFDRFEQVATSGAAAMRVKAIKRLALFSSQVPENVLTRAVPVLSHLLGDDSNRFVQEAATRCLTRVACQCKGSVFVETGQGDLVNSVLRLLRFSFHSDVPSLQTALVKCLWSLVTYCEETRVVVARNEGFGTVISLLNSRHDDLRRYLLEILSALALLREIRRVIVSYGGLRFLIEAASSGSMVSRERASQAIGLIAVTRSARRLVVESGVIPVLLDLLRIGDSKAKLVAANSLGVVSAHIDHIRLVGEAGAIPLYAELLRGPEPIGKEIAEDVFCLLAVAESNAVEIAQNLVRILREGDDEAKAAASDVLWDLSGYKHSISVVRSSGAIPVLVELLRDGSSEVKEKASGAIAQLSYNRMDRVELARVGAIPVLIAWLRDESEELRDNAAETLINFSQDPAHSEEVRGVIDDPTFRSMESRLVSVRASDELMARSMRRMSIEQLTWDPDLA